MGNAMIEQSILQALAGACVNTIIVRTKCIVANTKDCKSVLENKKWISVSLPIYQFISIKINGLKLRKNTLERQTPFLRIEGCLVF